MGRSASCSPKLKLHPQIRVTFTGGKQTGPLTHLTATTYELMDPLLDPLRCCFVGHAYIVSMLELQLLGIVVLSDIRVGAEQGRHIEARLMI